MQKEAIPSKILFFDGECSICNKAVDFSLKHNPKQNIYFSSLQSEFASDFLQPYNLNPKDLDSVIFYEDGKIFTESEAIFRLNKQLIGLRSSLFSFFKIIPRFVTDPIYRVVAKNRHRVIEKGKYCRIPTEEEAARFLG